MVHWQVFSFFWLDMVPECWRVLSRRGVGKALGYLSIWKPWSMHQHHTSSLPACYLCRAHYPADSDRQTGVRQIGDAEKSLSGHQGCTSWTTRTMQTHLFPLITANVLFSLSVRFIFCHTCLLLCFPHWPCKTAEGVPLDIWLTSLHSSLHYRSWLPLISTPHRKKL